MNKHFSIVEGLNSFINSSIHKIFFLLISLSLTTSLWSAESVYKTALFGSDYNSKGVSSYTDTWTSTNDGFEVTIVNGNNNNNGWSVVKFGRKNNASVGEITSTSIDKKITKVAITIDGINASVTNSIKLYTSSNGSTWTEIGSYTKATGEQAVTLSSPAANLYYKVEFDCASHSSNGFVTISKVDYYVNDDAPSYTITAATNNSSYGTVSLSGSVITANPATGYRVSTSTPYSISPSGSATVSQNGNEFTVTPSANTTVTINFEAIPSYTVTWMSNGESFTTTSVQDGQKPTFPTNPTSCDEDASGSKTFYGWSTAEWTGKIPDLTGKTVYKKASDMPAVSGAVTYYAVFCKGGTETITITNSDFTSALTGSYADQTITKTIGADEYVFNLNACMQSSMCQMRDNATVSYIQIPTLPGVITGISTTECANASGSSYSGTLHFKSSKTRGNSDTDDIAKLTLSSVTSFDWDLSSNTTATSGWFVTSAGLRLKDLTISYGSAGTDYMTNCTVCNENVTIYKGLEENGTFEVSPLGKRAACDHTVVVTVTPTPATGYRVATNGVTASAGSPTIVNNGDGTWTVTYAQHTNVSSTINVAFEAIPCRTYTFNAGSGTCATTSLTEALYGAGVTLPVATAPAGCDPEFTFAGWATASVSETTTSPALYAANTTYTGDDLTLYAVYKQGTGTEGFKLSIVYQEVEYFAANRTGTNAYMGASTNSADAATFNIVEKDSKKYLAWIDGSSTWYISCVTSDKATLTFSANINDASEWTVSDGGSTIELYSSYNNRYFTFNNNNKDRFAGYLSSIPYTLTKTDAGGTFTYNSNPTCLCTSVDITYDANGGTLATGCNNVTGGTCDQDWQLCAAPTREGYVFAGWKDQKGTIHNAEEEIISLHSSLTLTAQWIENPYTVNFDAGNGFCSKTSLTENSRGDGVKLPTATPVGQCADEWHFVGWTTTQLVGDDNTSYDLAGVANATYVPSVNNQTLYAVYSKVDISGDGDVVFSRYTASSIEEGLYLVLLYQMGDSYGRLKYAVPNSGRIPFEKEYEQSTVPSSITINSPSLSDYVFQFSNADGKWMLFNSGNETYLGAGSNGNLTWSARTPSLAYTATKESESSHWWRFQFDDGDNTYFFGPNKSSDYIRNYSSSTLSDTYCVALFKGAAGTTYYSCAPQCDECVEPGWSFRDGEHVTKTIGSPNYTNVVIEEHPSTGAVLYKSSNQDVATVNASTGEVTFVGKGTTIITLKLAKTSHYCAQVLQYELEVKDPAIEVVEITKTQDLNNPSDPNEYFGLVVDHDLEGTSQIVIKERETTLVGEYANDLFISKYFEAASNMKLFAIFNGTDHAVKFDDIRVRSNCSLAGIDVWASKKGDAGYVELKDITRLCETYPELEIPKGTELIFWSNNMTGSASKVTGCINMTINGKNYKYADMKNENIPNWYCLGDNVSYNTKDADGNNQFIFNGDDSMILERYNSETGQWEAIDVLGAGTSSAPYSVTTLKSERKIKQCTDKYYINGKSQALNDAIGFYAKCDGITIPYSTNRYMLIRKKEVKDGLHAVDANKTSFATLCEEWNGTPVGGEQEAYCYSGQRFAEIAQYDYAKEYVTYVDLPPETLSSFDNPDGTQTIIIKDMADRACNTLLITVNDASDKKLAETEFKIPIIVDNTNVETDDDIFYNQHDACASCDVIVMPGATLTKAADTEPKDKAIIRNLDIYAGGKLVVPNGTNYQIGALTLRTKLASDGLNLDVPELVINGSLQHKAKSITQWIRIDGRRYYNFIVPYPVRKSQITFANGEEAVFDLDYTIDVYDGEKRAQTQLGGNWTQYTGDILHPGVGYTMAVAPKVGHTYAELVLPMPDGDLSTGEPDSKSLYINAWGNEETRPNHKGWNLIGNPYLQTYGNDHLYTEAESMLTTGKLVPDEEHPGWWKNDNSAIPYVTMINSAHNDYMQVDVATTELLPFRTFFVQVGKPETASGTQVNLTFNKTSRKVSAAPKFVNKEERPSVTRVGFFITGDDAKDNFGIIVGDNYSPKYDMQADLSKEFGSLYSLKGYTLQDEDNLMLAFDAVHPDRLAQPIPVGVRLPKQGEYTFSIDERYNLGAFEHIYLTDNVMNKHVDLIGESYTFEGTKEQINNRFSLTLVLRPKVVTSIDEVVSGMYISSRDGAIMLTGLPKNADVYVYDMAGHIVSRDHISNHSTAVYSVPSGVYQVRVVSNGENALFKTIVY